MSICNETLRTKAQLYYRSSVILESCEQRHTFLRALRFFPCSFKDKMDRTLHSKRLGRLRMDVGIALAPVMCVSSSKRDGVIYFVLETIDKSTTTVDDGRGIEVDNLQTLRLVLRCFRVLCVKVIPGARYFLFGLTRFHLIRWTAFRVIAGGVSVENQRGKRLLVREFAVIRQADESRRTMCCVLRHLDITTRRSAFG